MCRTADDQPHDPHVADPTDASRRELLSRLAARFDEGGADALDWDALCRSKQDAWPMPRDVTAAER